MFGGKPPPPPAPPIIEAKSMPIHTHTHVNHHRSRQHCHLPCHPCHPCLPCRPCLPYLPCRLYPKQHRIDHHLHPTIMFFSIFKISFRFANRHTLLFSHYLPFIPISFDESVFTTFFSQSIPPAFVFLFQREFHAASLYFPFALLQKQFH